jgi:protein-S-isoprenylcysteine O-methyltransferase Ste14
LMVGATWLFAASSSALGRNWSIVARMRSDHELIRSGPYARVRHPIYLGLLLFLLALAVAFGHWPQLIIAVPLYLAGTRIRTDVEDRLLEQTFGESFREYRNSTPALLPRF